MSEAEASAENGAAQIDPEIAKQIGQLRARMREGFGKVLLAMMAQARYDLKQQGKPVSEIAAALGASGRCYIAR